MRNTGKPQGIMVSFFVSALFFCGLNGSPAVAQTSHLAQYQQLLDSLRQHVLLGVSKVTGDSVPGIELGLHYQDTLPVLNLSYPEISYTKTSTKRSVRTMSISFLIIKKENEQRGYSYTVRDTLTRAQARQARKESPKALRGEPISATMRLAKPAIWIAGSIGTVIALFVMRTQ